MPTIPIIPAMPVVHQLFSRRACPARRARAVRPTTAVFVLALACALPPARAQVPGTPPGFAPPGAAVAPGTEGTAPAPVPLPAPNPNTVYREIRVHFADPAADQFPANPSPVFGNVPLTATVYQSLDNTLAQDPSAAAQVYAGLKHLPLAAVPEGYRPFTVNVVTVPTTEPGDTIVQFALTPVRESDGNNDRPADISPDAYADALADLAKQRALANWAYTRQSAQLAADAAQQTFRDADEALANQKARIQNLRDQLAHSTHRTDLSPTAIRAAIESLETERQKLDIDVAGLKARHDAIEETLAAQTKRTQDAAQTDPVAEELKKAVAIREQQVDLLKRQNKAGVAPDVDVQNATLALADAKARLAERQLAAAGGADTLASLNRELLTLTIELREKDARLQFVTGKLAAYADAATQATDLQMLQARLPKLQDTFDTTNAAAVTARRAVDPYKEPPTITLTNPTTQPAKSPEKS